MEKRSRRRIRDLVTHLAFQGLAENEIGCARISIVAKSTNALFTGRIQKRKTNCGLGLVRPQSYIRPHGAEKLERSVCIVTSPIKVYFPVIAAARDLPELRLSAHGA